MLDENNSIFIRHATGMFRPEIIWGNLGDYLDNRFRDEDKVNTYIYACSNGSEAYTMSILLSEVFKDDAKKFSPIIAKDIERSRIEQAQRQQHDELIPVCNAYLPAKWALNLEDDELQKYIIRDREKEKEWIRGDVARDIQFSKANILEDLDSIDTNNPSIFMCRNMWPYVKSEEYDDFAKALYERLAEGSVVILGEYDITGEIDKLTGRKLPNSDRFPQALLNAGFRVSKDAKSICPVYNLVFEKNHTTQNTLSFKGNAKTAPRLERGQMVGKDNEILTRPDTSMFRYDLHWAKFGDYLSQRFSSADKVNTIVYGCSTGEEPYTLSISLQYGASYPEKFFPIIAKDINGASIEENIQNQHGDRIIKECYRRTRKTLNLDEEEIKQYAVFEDNKVEKLTDKVTEPVIFSCANILDDIENIDPKVPSLIMCRNMWPYIDSKEYEAFAAKLYDKLAKGSVVVIGGYDYYGEDGLENSDKFPQALLQAGFKPADFTKYINYDVVFEKN